MFKVEKTRKVVIFDFEMPKERYAQRIEQVQGKYNIQDKDKDNLFIITVRDNDDFKDFNVFDVSGQNKVLSILMQIKAEVVIFDNLSKMLKTSANNSQSIHKLIDFFHKIEAMGVAVILIHHTNKGEKKSNGAYELQSMFQNVFKVTGRRQLEECSDLHENVKNALDNDTGALICLEVEESKEAYELEGTKHYFSLSESHGVWEEISLEYTQESKEEQGAENIEFTGQSVEHESALASISTLESCEFAATLSKEAKELFDKLAGKAITRVEVQKAFKCSDKTALKYLNELINAGLVQRIGEGPSTKYKKL